MCGWKANSDDDGDAPANGCSARQSANVPLAVPSTPPESRTVTDSDASRGPPVCVPDGSASAPSQLPSCTGTKRTWSPGTSA